MTFHKKKTSCNVQLFTHIERLLLDLHSDRPDAPEGGQGEAGRDGDAGDGRHLQALQMQPVLGIEFQGTKLYHSCIATICLIDEHLAE